MAGAGLHVHVSGDKGGFFPIPSGHCTTYGFMVEREDRPRRMASQVGQFKRSRIDVKGKWANRPNPFAYVPLKKWARDNGYVKRGGKWQSAS